MRDLLPEVAGTGSGPRGAVCGSCPAGCGARTRRSVGRLHGRRRPARHARQVVASVRRRAEAPSGCCLRSRPRAVGGWVGTPGGIHGSPRCRVEGTRAGRGPAGWLPVPGLSPDLAGDLEGSPVPRVRAGRRIHAGRRTRGARPARRVAGRDLPGAGPARCGGFGHPRHRDVAVPMTAGKTAVGWPSGPGAALGGPHGMSTSRCGGEERSARCLREGGGRALLRAGGGGAARITIGRA